MRVLILGGTQFIGRHIVEHLLAGGHSVSVFNRGRSPDPLPASVERIRGDRDEGAAGISALRGRLWDVCLDISAYTPRRLRPAATLLRSGVLHYVFISAVSVYGDPSIRPVTENNERVPPVSEDVVEINSETYGRLKVACENIVQEVYGTNCCMLRPQIVVGPEDPTDRCSYWVRRAMHGGEVLAPGDGSDHVQFIDVRDVARFARVVVEQALRGAFNLSGHRLTWATFMKLLGAEQVSWAPATLLAEAGVNEFELPLYRPERGPRSGLMHVSNERAMAAGLTLTDPATTLADVRQALLPSGIRAPFSAERERQLLNRLKKANPGTGPL